MIGSELLHIYADLIKSISVILLSYSLFCFNILVFKTDINYLFQFHTHTIEQFKIYI